MTYASHGNRMVRMYGQITANDGLCGGNRTCWTFEHGGVSQTLRTSGDVGSVQAAVGVGDCVEVVAPVSTFFTTTQVDPSPNDDWLRLY